MARKFAREEIVPAAAAYDKSGEVSVIGNFRVGIHLLKLYLPFQVSCLHYIFYLNHSPETFDQSNVKMSFL